VRKFTAGLLASLLLITLLGMIAVVLIAPEVDLPDTAFQRNSSPQTIRAQATQSPDAQVSTLAASGEIGGISSDPADGRGTHAQCLEPVPSLRMPLRC
jgi:hypothetical protein